MKGISMTSQPNSRSVEESAPACCLARETRTRHPARGRFAAGGEIFGNVGVLRLRSRKRRDSSAQDDRGITFGPTTDNGQLAAVSRLLWRNCGTSVHLF